MSFQIVIVFQMFENFISICNLKQFDRFLLLYSIDFISFSRDYKEPEYEKIKDINRTVK